MNFLNKIFPGSENNIGYSPDRGDNKPISSGGPMRSLSIKNEDEPEIAVEQPTVENPVADKETANEKLREIIDNSFARVFAVENNRDVRIFSQRKDKETPIGAHLKNGFYETGMLYKLGEMFFSAYGDNEDVNEKNIDQLVKNFCLDNVDGFNGSEDMKTAVKAVCNKSNEAVAIKDEKIDEKLEKDINDAWDEICNIADELGRKNNEDRDSGLYNEEAKEFFNKEAKKIDTLILEVNGRVKSDGSISEYTEGVLEFFKNHIEKLTKLQEEYEKNKQQFRKVEIKKDEQNLENCKKLIVNIFDIAKEEIEKTQFTVNLKDEKYYWENFDQVKTEGLSEEELKEFQSLAAGARKEISKVLEKRKKDLNEIEKKKKPLVEKVETKVEVEKNEIIEDENSKIANEFRNAVRNIADKHLSLERFEEVFKIKLADKMVLDGDMIEKLMEYADLIESEHSDVASREQHKDFWDNFGVYQTLVEKINNPAYPKRLVIVEGKTYAVDKNFKSDVIGETEIGIKNEKEPNEVFELSLELAKNFKDKLAEALQENEEYKKLRTEYQESFLDGQTVAFLDELLEQEKIIADAEKEVFIKKVLIALAK